MKHYFFVVEGAHDLAAISRVLKLLGINEEVKTKDKLSKTWESLIPNKFPFNFDILDRITPIPSFFQNKDYSVAIKVAGSDNRLLPTLDETLSILPFEDISKLDGILLFCDADNKNPQEKINAIAKHAKSISELTFDIDSFMNMGVIKTKVKDIKSDYYVFPDNTSAGTLESLLIEGANIVYKDLLESSEEYVKSVKECYREKWSITSEKKVLVGCIANVLKPGKANQVSICDNDWISETTVNQCDKVKKIYNFIKEFLDTKVCSLSI